MIKVWLVKLVADAEYNASILYEAHRPQENRIGVDDKDMLKTTSFNDWKIEFYQLL